MLAAAAQTKEYVRIWQYQIEFTGGQRHGPSFNHKIELEHYVKGLPASEFNGRSYRLVRYWTLVPKNKFKVLKQKIPKNKQHLYPMPEIVK